MAIILNDNLSIQAPKAADSRYGPHADTATAIAAVISANRYQGLVVGITSGSSVVEYWWRDGTADGNLIIKVDSTANTAINNANAAFDKANTANITAQAAFTFANTVNVYAYSAYSTANSAQSNTVITQGVDATQNTWISANAVFSQAAFTQANTANNTAQAAFIFANTVNVYSYSAYAQANASNNTAGAAFNHANAAFAFANTISGGSAADGFARNTANAAFDKANSANVLAQAAFDKANTGSSLTGLLPNAVIFANSTGYTTNSSSLLFTTSNNTLIVANITVPTIYTTTGGIVFPDGSSQTTAGVATDSYARNTANAAFNQANAANVLAQSGYNFANTVNIFTQSAFTQANSANVLAQAAYDAANSAGSSVFTQAAFNTANSAQANTIVTQGVDYTQNLSITAAFAKANAANILAQAAFNKANTGASGSFIITFSPYSDYGWIGDPIVPVTYDYGTL